MDIVKTVCARDCPDTCFIDASVKDGRIVKIRGAADNPFTNGFLCPRGYGDPKRVYSEKRVLYPHLQSMATGSRAFERASWDDALAKVSTKIRDTIDQHGSEAMLLYDYPGNQGFLSWQFPRRLWMALGATTTDYSLCSSSGHAGIGMHYGLTYGISVEALLHSAVIVFWGNNARVSSPHQWALAQQSRKNNGSIIVSIDPRKSGTSQAADISLQPRPGSDVALAYGLAGYLIRNQGTDDLFLEKWATGYEDYKQEVLRWTPDRVERITRVPYGQIEKVGALLVKHKEAAAFMIGLGLQKSTQGAEAARAVALLPALMGRHRGFHYSDSKGRDVGWDTINGSRQTTQGGRKVNQVSIGKRLAEGEFKLVFVLGTNPAMTLPDSAAVRAGLQREDVFVVVQDTHWSETAELADVVLPAPTYLEKQDVVFCDHHPYVRLSQEAIEPLGESRHEFHVMQELATRLGRKEDWLFQDPWRALDEAFRNTFVTGGLKDLIDGSVLELKSRALNRYQTPSGKIEFSASQARDMGESSVPFQDEMKFDEQWFVLLNSATAKHTHSQFTDVYGPIPQIVWIHPVDAQKSGIQDGAIVEVYNDHACVLLKSKVTSNASMGTLWAPRPLVGLNNVPLNALVPGTAQRIGGGPIFNSVQVKINQTAAGPKRTFPHADRSETSVDVQESPC